MDKKQYAVLIVDDSEDERFFHRQILQRFPRFVIVGEVCDGEDAIAYLSGETIFADRHKYPLPDLMLLDLKMPRKSGFEVLEWLRTQSFPELTVVVLSGSPLAEDIEASLALGAHAYWIKTSDVDKQNKMAQLIEGILHQRRFNH